MVNGLKQVTDALPVRLSGYEKEMYSTHFFLKSCNTSHMLYHYFI